MKSSKKNMRNIQEKHSLVANNGVGWLAGNSVGLHA